MPVLSFMDMPPEVRNQIYDSLFEGAVIEDYGLSPQPIRTKNYHLAITMTSRQVRAESLSVLQLATTFHFRIGQAEATPVPSRVLKEIRTVRLPAHRLKTFDTSSFVRLETLVLDVSIDPTIWRLYQISRNKSRNTFADISDMINLGMALGVFEHSWDLDKIWRDQGRQFRILCWFSSWVREDQERQVRSSLNDKASDHLNQISQPILVDIDSGMILQESRLQQ